MKLFVAELERGMVADRPEATGAVSQVLFELGDLVRPVHCRLLRRVTASRNFRVTVDIDGRAGGRPDGGRGAPRAAAIVWDLSIEIYKNFQIIDF
jgi:hypothetical protein